jgi:hypothetical protein
MMKNTLCFPLFLLLLCAAPAAQQDALAPTVLIANFFDSLKKGEIDKAYDELVKGTKIAERPKDIATLKGKTTEAVALFGPIQGHEILETKLVGSHLARFTCLSLGKNFPLRWRFYFYLAEPSWRLIDIRVDDRLADIFEEGEQADGAVQKK